MNQIVEYYDEIAPSYDEDRFNNTYGRFIDTQERKILEQLLSDQELIIMDLACGSGRLLRYAGIGLDASTEMLQLAKNKFPEKTGLPEFLMLVTKQRESNQEEIDAAIVEAENEMISNGIVALGDVSNNANTFIQKSKKNLYYHTFIELIAYI